MRRGLWAFSLFVLATIPTATGSADEITGTWTGEVSIRGNYYWETSTRVVAPEVGGELVSPNGTSVSATYLVDSITSASQAAGATEDVRFTEIRHDMTLNVAHEFSLQGSSVDAVGTSFGLHLSFEPDYTSFAATAGTQLYFNDRSTTLNLDVTVLHDEVRRNFRGPPPADTSAGLGAAFNENFDALSLGVGVDQVLSPVVVVDLRYDFVYLNGYLANAYRRVMVGGAALPENHPDIRRRHTLSARLRYYLRPTRTVFQLRYRAYVDSWNLAALNPEFRIYQPFGDFLTVRARYRYYTQRQAFFYEANPQDYQPGAVFVSSDPKMSRFHSHEAGLKLTLRLGFLEDTVLDPLSGASLDMSFNYIWRTSTFGDAVIAQVGLTVPL